jgi:hypothetical protein
LELAKLSCTFSDTASTLASASPCNFGVWPPFATPGRIKAVPCFAMAMCTSCTSPLPLSKRCYGVFTVQRCWYAGSATLVPAGSAPLPQAECCGAASLGSAMPARTMVLRGCRRTVLHCCGLSVLHCCGLVVLHWRGLVVLHWCRLTVPAAVAVGGVVTAAVAVAAGNSSAAVPQC